MVTKCLYMKLYFLAIITVLLLITSTVIGQTVKMDDGLLAEFQKSGVIKKHNEINGYYFFYKIKERNRKERIYYLDILDKDLETISKKKIIGSKSLSLINSAFNGQHFLFKYLDSKERKIHHKIYDKEGQLISIKTKDISKKTAKNYLHNSDEMYKTNFPELFAIPNHGFISYTLNKKSKKEYEVDFISSISESQDWMFSSNPNSSDHKEASLLTFSEKVVISLVEIKNSATSDLSKYKLIANDIQSGENIFRLNLNDDKYAIELTTGKLIPETNEVILLGEFYDTKLNSSKNTSLGLFTYKMNLSGEITDRKYHLWSESEKNTSTENKKDKKMSIWFHDFIHANDGSIIAVGEKYKKAVDGAGVAVNVLDVFLGILLGYYAGPSESMTKIVIEDMYLYKFSPEFELDTTIVIDKNRKDLQLAPGSGFLSTRSLGQYVSNIGGFDYAFTQLNEKGNDFEIIYMLEKFNQNRYEKTICGTLKYENGEITQQETPMEFYSNSEIINMYPATDGYVLFTEYFYNEEKIDNRFLKLK